MFRKKLEISVTFLDFLARKFRKTCWRKKLSANISRQDAKYLALFFKPPVEHFFRHRSEKILADDHFLSSGDPQNPSISVAHEAEIPSPGLVTPGGRQIGQICPILRESTDSVRIHGNPWFLEFWTVKTCETGRLDVQTSEIRVPERSGPQKLLDAVLRAGPRIQAPRFDHFLARTRETRVWPPRGAIIGSWRSDLLDYARICTISRESMEIHGFAWSDSWVARSARIWSKRGVWEGPVTSFCPSEGQNSVTTASISDLASPDYEMWADILRMAATIQKKEATFSLRGG